MRYTITGTHRGVYDGIEPRGRMFTMLELGHYRVAGGRFVESWFLYDAPGLRRQLTQA
ncbi:hypothetical protein Sm713_79800 [Streptomyces sp. TS71-3]|nr:hypothetical protein Sm713_79800 [Streptomyces sp. TS71-3]